MIEVHKLYKLRTFYPSQWEGRTSEGEIIYIRYRHGQLEAWINDQNDQRRVIFMEQTGERHGFDTETDHMKSLLSSVCRFLDGDGGKERYKLDDLVEQINPDRRLTEEDRQWLDAPAVGKEEIEE